MIALLLSEADQGNPNDQLWLNQVLLSWRHLSNLTWIWTCGLSSVQRALYHCATLPSFLFRNLLPDVIELSSSYNIICVDALRSPAGPTPSPHTPIVCKGEGLYITPLVATTKTAADTPRLSLLFPSRACACGCSRASHCPRPLTDEYPSPATPSNHPETLSRESSQPVLLPCVPSRYQHCLLTTSAFTAQFTLSWSSTTMIYQSLKTTMILINILTLLYNNHLIYVKYFLGILNRVRYILPYKTVLSTT